MRKLLLIILVLTLVASVWAQSVIVQTVGSIAEARFKVHMAGLSITITGAGIGQSTGTLLGTWAGWTVLSTYTLEYEGSLAMPCDRVHGVLWVENTGGMSADIFTYTGYEQQSNGSCADNAWSIVSHGATAGSWLECVPLNPNQYKFGFATNSTGLGTSTGHAFAGSTFDGLTYSGVANGTVTQWFNDIVAEDPALRGDGTWASQTDQRDLDIIITVPPSATGCATESGSSAQMDTHYIKLMLRAQLGS